MDQLTQNELTSEYGLLSWEPRLRKAVTAALHALEARGWPAERLVKIRVNKPSRVAILIGKRSAQKTRFFAWQLFMISKDAIDPHSGMKFDARCIYLLSNGMLYVNHTVARGGMMYTVREFLESLSRSDKGEMDVVMQAILDQLDALRTG